MDKDIVDFIRSAVDQKPLEARDAFNKIMDNKISSKIEQEFDNYKANFFGVEEEQDAEEEDTENEDAE